jgi:hypothetical protein
MFLNSRISSFSVTFLRSEINNLSVKLFLFMVYSVECSNSLLPKDVRTDEPANATHQNGRQTQYKLGLVTLSKCLQKPCIWE